MICLEINGQNLDYSFPYQNIGLDYAESIYFKNCEKYRKKKMVKCYFLVITCCCTKVVHIELTPDLSVESFLLVFGRFIWRYGMPKNISDFLKHFKAIEVQNLMLYLQIKWSFKLEKSSWWGTFYDSMVHTIKNTLKKVGGIRL